MRIRSIKPEFWRSSSISCLPVEDRLLFIGLWSYVDDNGVGLDKLSAICADLFADDMEHDFEHGTRETVARVSRGLQALSDAGRIVRYKVAKRSYLAVVNWDEHQKIDRPGKARYPLPTSTDAIIRDTLATPSRESRDTPSTGAGEQGNRGTGEQGNSNTPLAGSVGAPDDAAKPKRGTRLDPAFVPAEKSRQAILGESPDLNLVREHAKFVDHWSSQPGQRGVKLDWDATWRNWMRRAADDLARKPKSRQQQTDDLFDRAMARAEAADAIEGSVL